MSPIIYGKEQGVQDFMLKSSAIQCIFRGFRGLKKNGENTIIPDRFEFCFASPASYLTFLKVNQDLTPLYHHRKFHNIFTPTKIFKFFWFKNKNIEIIKKH